MRRQAEPTAAYAAVAWERVLEACRESLNPEDYEHIQTFPSYDAMIESIREIQTGDSRHDLPSILSGVPQAMSRLSDFLLVFAVVTTEEKNLLQTTVLWGALHLVIRVCASYNTVYNTIFKETLGLLEDMSHDLQVFNMYEWLFCQDCGLDDLVVDVISDVVIFWVHMARFLRRNPLVNMARISWSTIREEFDETTSRIRKRLKQVKEAAEALSLKQATLQREQLEMAMARVSSAETSLEHILPFSNIPLPQNPQFFGRSEVLLEIHKELDGDPEIPRYKSMILTGLGGVGKTQVALRYAYERLSGGIQVVLWIHGDGDLAVQESFTEVANLLRLPGASETPSRNTLLVRQWLQKCKVPWLLVFDNVEDSMIVTKSIPNTTRGSVLITTRHERVAIETASKAYRLPFFTPLEGSTMLLNIVRPEYHSPEDLQAAVGLSEELGGLPLALKLVASQILSRRISVAKFTRLFAEHPRRLLNSGKLKDVYYGWGVDTAFHGSFDSLNETAVTVFGVVCFVSPKDIPDSLFRPDPNSSIGKEDPWNDTWEVDAAIEDLLSASLLNKDPITERYHVHRLVQQAFRDWLGDSRREVAFDNATGLLFEAFPKVETEGTLHPFWPTCKTYVQLVVCLGENARRLQYDELPWPRTEHFIKLLLNAAWYLIETSAMNQSDEVLKIGLKCCKDTDGLLYAALCELAGIIRREQGRPSLAYPWLEKCVAIRRRFLPADSPMLARSVSNMAGTLLSDYCTEEALRLYNEALAIYLGMPRAERQKHIYIPYLNLAIAYTYKEMYATSYKMLDLSHEYILAEFGPGSHFDAMGDLYRSTVLTAERKYAAAREAAQAAIKNFMVEAEYHPTTLGAHYKLSIIDLAEDKVEDAINRLRRALEICEVVEPTRGLQGHTARASWKLSHILLKLDPSSDEGECLLDRAERIRKEMQGDKFDELPPNDHSYDMLIAHFFR